jgi:hypothetical protein
MEKANGLARTQHTSGMIPLDVRKRFREEKEGRGTRVPKQLPEMASAPGSELMAPIGNSGISRHLIVSGCLAARIVPVARMCWLCPRPRVVYGGSEFEWSRLSDDDTLVLTETSWHPLAEKVAIVGEPVRTAAVEWMNAIQAKFAKIRSNKRKSPIARIAIDPDKLEEFIAGGGQAPVRDCRKENSGGAVG